MIRTLQTDIRFDGAQTPADYVNDTIQNSRALAVVKMAKWLGFNRLREQIGFLDCFQDGQDRTIRRIDAVMHYWKGPIQWIIDGLGPAEGSLGDVSPYLQIVIDKAIARKGTSFSFGELDGPTAAADLDRYAKLASRVNFHGREIYAPPVACYPGNNWEDAASLVMKNAWVKKSCAGLSHNTYGRTHQEVFALVAKVETVLRRSGKQVTQQECGGSPKWTGLYSYDLGRWIGTLVSGLYQRGADFGLYGWLEEPGFPDEARFSISRETVLQGYLSV